jgi:hypothetical protein
MAPYYMRDFGDVPQLHNHTCASRELQGITFLLSCVEINPQPSEQTIAK